MKNDLTLTRVCDCSEADLLAELLRRIYRPKQLKTAKECLEVELPEWFKPEEWSRLQGDAGTASGKFFQLYFKRGHKRDGVTTIKIFCPQFLRGPLTIDVDEPNNGVWGSY